MSRERCKSCDFEDMTLREMMSCPEYYLNDLPPSCYKSKEFWRAGHNLVGQESVVSEGKIVPGIERHSRPILEASSSGTFRVFSK